MNASPGEYRSGSVVDKFVTVESCQIAGNKKPTLRSVF